jgi:hypothetical protein
MDSRRRLGLRRARGTVVPLHLSKARRREFGEGLSQPDNTVHRVRGQAPREPGGLSKRGRTRTGRPIDRGGRTSTSPARCASPPPPSRDSRERSGAPRGNPLTGRGAQARRTRHRVITVRASPRSGRGHVVDRAPQQVSSAGDGLPIAPKTSTSRSSCRDKVCQALSQQGFFPYGKASSAAPGRHLPQPCSLFVQTPANSGWQKPPIDADVPLTGVQSHSKRISLMLLVPRGREARGVRARGGD